MMRVRTVAATVVGLGIVLTFGAWSVATASTPIPAEPAGSSGATATVSTMVAALNAHDVDEAMTLFADSATVQEDRRPQTPEQIRGWLGQLARENLRLDLRGRPTVGPDQARARGESVAWSATLWRTRDRQSGPEQINATVRAIVLDHRVAFLSIRANSGAVPLPAVAG
jgi:hypothetical protein